jgi:N-acyl-D-amino-acid deacylase
MTDSEKLFSNQYGRRDFLEWMAKASALSALSPLLLWAGPAKASGSSGSNGPVGRPAEAAPRTPKIRINAINGRRTLLKNGLIADGSGQKAFIGDLLINGDLIEMITPGEIFFEGPTVDCTGLVVAPGFIDMHSHMDWVLPIKGHPELKDPFTAQGVTTFVGGNCGFGIAGFKTKSRFKDMIATRTKDLYDLQWETMGPYFDFLKTQGITHNLVNLAGHGTSRTSIRGFDPTPLEKKEMQELLDLLAEAMDQGAHGVSLGLQYEPGVFATMEELRQVARLVKEKDKILTVHMKAYSSLSGTYPLEFFGRPHNLLAIEDMIRLARETGVRLQLSHLIFVGSRTWETCQEALEMIDRAIADGLDIKFDTYAYHCGTSIINVFLPEWFLAEIPKAYDQSFPLLRLRAEIMLIEKLLGFGYDDIQITDARHPSLTSYNGMFLKDIAAKRGMSPFENFIDIAQKSEGRARVLNHRYSSMDNLKRLMQHPAALFMTDATPALKGVQNPGSYGNFPLFLQYTRDLGLMSMEACIHKMTGASAERFNLKKRGLLKKGFAADITVFDWNKVRDNNSRTKTDQKPSGMEIVFLNGKPVMVKGNTIAGVSAGRVL